MALHWNIENVKDSDSLKVQEGTDSDGALLYRLHHKTEALIFACISVGIGTITEDNAAEFYARIRIIEGARGAMCYGPIPEGHTGRPPEDPFTIGDIRRHIGLGTNVSYETREQWAQRMIVGKGDGLSKYGERKLTDEEIERREEELSAKAERLYEEGRYDEAEELTRRVDYMDVTITRDIVQAYNAFAGTEQETTV
jgi:hypothetical protein